MTRSFGHSSRLDWVVFLNILSPTHSPNPSLAPPGERGGLHVAACLKVGKETSRGTLASKWQHGMTRPSTQADAVLVFSSGLASSVQITLFPAVDRA